MNLIFRFGHVVEQKFQDQGAAEAASLDLEMGEAHGQVSVFDIVDADEAWILHGLGEAITLASVRRDTDVIGAIFAETLAADVFIAGFAVIAAEPATLIAEKLNFVFLRLRQGVQLLEILIEPEVRHHISEIILVQFVFKIPEISQDFRGGGNVVQTGIFLFQIVQKQIGVDDQAVSSGLLKC